MVARIHGLKGYNGWLVSYGHLPFGNVQNYLIYAIHN